MRRINWQATVTKRALMVIYDIIAVNLAYIIAQLSINTVFNEASIDVWISIFAQRAIPVTLIFFVLLNAFKVYISMWEYAGIKELSNICAAVLIGGLSSVAIDLAMTEVGLAMAQIDRGCLSI